MLWQGPEQLDDVILLRLHALGLSSIRRYRGHHTHDAAISRFAAASEVFELLPCDMAARRPASSNLAILITADEQMQAVPVSDHIAANDIGANPIDTITVRSDVVFWFNTASQSPVNRMATLNLYAASGLSARAVPLLHGTVLITAVNADGDPIGLSQHQLGLLQARPAPNWWAQIILQTRTQRWQCSRPAR